MSEALSINRRKSTVDDASFESLRSEAIKLVQQVSGKVWTDYNLHDPGITILEQLIYAITDIIYRTEFPVEDYLSEINNEIAYDSLSLHSPSEAFPCRPTTINDYRKIILDGAEGVVNVWINPVKKTPYSGLYNISVKVDNQLSDDSPNYLEDKIHQLYNENRNLCEDMAELNFITNVEYELSTVIEVKGSRLVEDILADIYTECSEIISCGVSSTQLSLLLNEDKALDDVYDGPLNSNGYINKNQLDVAQHELLFSSLYTAINSIGGVKSAGEVYLQKDGRQYFERYKYLKDGEIFTDDDLVTHHDEHELSLLIPEQSDQIKIVLSKSGRIIPVDISRVRRRISEKKVRHESARSTNHNPSTGDELTKGVSREISNYSSIQNQFPANYGVNSLGVPKSAPLEVKAKARQLKSYLVIFEQLLTNYLANIDGIKSLFSIDNNVKRTYSYNVFNNNQIADIDSIYPDNVSDVIKNIISKYDNYNNRKSRLLDYLLALYGEKFTQNSLRLFNYYYSNNEVEALIINNKIDFLSTIIESGRNRGAAENLAATTDLKSSYSGLQRRVSMLLGFKKHSTHSLTLSILRQDVKLVKHHVYEQINSGSDNLSLINIDDIDKNVREIFDIIPLDDFDNNTSDIMLLELLSDTIPVKNKLLSDYLLRGGVSYDKYKIVKNGSDNNYQLLFKYDENTYWSVGAYEDKQSANKTANALRQFLILLNKKSEGLHIVEHIMLRPIGSDNNQLESRETDDFHSFRISVIFSIWTARCYNKEFRKLAEETVRINIPAHLSVDFYWLCFKKMYDFEIIYSKWINLRRHIDSDVKEIDECSSQLKSFLVMRHAHIVSKDS